MHQLFWNKYLPVIRILLKKARQEEQVLQLDATDFEKAGLSRKAGYKFEIIFKQGRIDNVISSSPLAAALAAQLQQEPAIRDILAEDEHHFVLNTKSQLSIKHLPQLQDA